MAFPLIPIALAAMKGIGGAAAGGAGGAAAAGAAKGGFMAKGIGMLKGAATNKIGGIVSQVKGIVGNKDLSALDKVGKIGDMLPKEQKKDEEAPAWNAGLIPGDNPIGPIQRPQFHIDELAKRIAG